MHSNGDSLAPPSAGRKPSQLGQQEELPRKRVAGIATQAAPPAVLAGQDSYSVGSYLQQGQDGALALRTILESRRSAVQNSHVHTM
eukprot:scaffold7849_cov457-Prasinococcus_capsulatus_cf.AAC.5